MENTLPTKGINEKTNNILEAIMSYAQLDFNTSKIELSESADVLDAISSGVNMMGEELKENVISLKEIHHRVKNNMQIISSMLRLQFSNESDERLVKMVQDSQNRIYAMALVHEMLYSSSSFKYVNFGDYLSSLTKSLFESCAPDNHKIELILDIPQKTLFEIDQIIPLGLMINEIITNSLKHAFENDKGQISIKVYLLKDKFIVKVKDNGKGFPKNFNVNKDANLGMQLIFLLAEQIEGIIKTEENSGVGYEITFKSSFLPFSAS